MKDNNIKVSLFRVPTSEILFALRNRALFQNREDDFKEFTSEELLKYILENRMSSFWNS